jgi:hypothetical protein
MWVICRTAPGGKPTMSSSVMSEQSDSGDSGHSKRSSTLDSARLKCQPMP